MYIWENAAIRQMNVLMEGEGVHEKKGCIIIWRKDMREIILSKNVYIGGGG